MTKKARTLFELAELTQSTIEGDGDILIERVATLGEASAGAISFLANPRYRRELDTTQASAVIIPTDQTLTNASLAVLRSHNPYLAFARIARILNPQRTATGRVTEGAHVAADAHLEEGVEVADGVVIESGARIGRGSMIGAGAVIGAGVVIGQRAIIEPNVTIIAAARLGDDVHIHSGAVIGGDGFGFAKAEDHWEAVPQLGSVIIADQVSVGANTTIDRGSLGDTRIERGCKIDNLVQIAHNVQIGEHTVIAACTGISGSTRIGRYCTIAGQVGVAGHLEIADHTTLTGMTMVTGSIKEPGVYSSGVPAAPNREWRRNAVRFRQLETLARRVEALEKQLADREDPDEH